MVAMLWQQGPDGAEVLRMVTAAAWVFAQLVLTALLPFLAREAVRWLRAAVDDLRRQIEAAGHADKLKTLQTLARWAVTSAEQMGAAEIIKDKRDWAVSFLSDQLEARGIYLDEDAIVAAIESAVYDEFNRYRKLDPLFPPPAATPAEAAG